MQLCLYEGDILPWHPSYLEQVLKPDYGFACKHLSCYFLDAMCAHVATVKQLPSVQTHRTRIETLEAALRDLYDSSPAYDPDIPDLYFHFNHILEAKLGQDTVSFLRLGLSRNDLDMTVYKMYNRKLLLELTSNLSKLRRALVQQAKTHIDTVLIAYTHHQPGQPTSLAHYLLAVEAALGRDCERALQAYTRLNTCPLGAAALAGSSHPLERSHSAKLLGFDTPVANTYDAVASADWQTDLAHVSQSAALTLSRFVCDLLGWATQHLFHVPDGLVQGSSIMPQKRNPVALEHARTHFSRALGAAQSIFYAQHNIPFGDLNDFGPDIQGSLRNLFKQLGGGLALLVASLEGGHFHEVALVELAAQSDTTATELADVLTRDFNVSFQQGHHLAAALVVHQQTRKQALQAATPEDLAAIGGPQLTASTLHDALSPQAFISRRNGFGGPARSSLKPQVMHAEHQLNVHLGTLQKHHHKLEDARQRLRARKEAA
jgi:argininosuccinate lyase